MGIGGCHQLFVVECHTLGGEERPRRRLCGLGITFTRDMCHGDAPLRDIRGGGFADVFPCIRQDDAFSVLRAVPVVPEVPVDAAVTGDAGQHLPHVVHQCVKIDWSSTDDFDLRQCIVRRSGKCSPYDRASEVPG